MTALQATWYLLVGVLLTGYGILDGFDLGVGFWHLRARGDAERRTLLNAVGPVWDGNEVWLLTGAGALFAAFPPVYAAVFSGFYLAMVLLLLALISRAVSLEFRSKEESLLWRKSWDAVFSVSSTVAALLLGTALGNVLRGVPLDRHGDCTVGFLDLLNPYALGVGVLTLALFAFHGANYAALKASGDLAARARRWASVSGAASAALFLGVSSATIAGQPHLMANFGARPVLWSIPVLALASVLASVRFSRGGRAGRAFLCSSLSIAAMMAMVGAALFPTLVPALGDPPLSLTAANASSSERTLKTMLILAALGMPAVLGYTIWVYRAFRGKVNPGDESNHY